VKTIVVSGSASHIGKTTLVRGVKRALSSRRVQAIKIGHGSDQPGKDERLFHDVPSGLAYIQERLAAADTDVLIIESSSIYEHFRPDLGILLVCPWEPEKESARIARQHADITIDRFFDRARAAAVLRQKLGNDDILPVLESQFLFYERDGADA